MKKCFVLLILLICEGCNVSNLDELRKNGEHQVDYVNGSLQDVYSRLIERYSECGIPVSNTFINNKNNIAGLSYMLTEYGWWLSHVDLREKTKNEIQIDIYYAHTRGVLGKFIKIEKYVTENIAGCP